MLKNEISIILPVYNKQRYILNILQDIKEQIFKEFECIIIDDGSTDDSGKICDEFAKKDSRFKIIHIKNQGVSHARNTGLKQSTGRYITFIDADDRIEPNYLKSLYAAANESQADIVIASYKKWWEEREEHVKVELPYSGMWKLEDLLPDFAEIQKKTGIYGFCWGKLLKAKILSGIWFNDNYILAEDFEYYLRIYPKISTIYFENKCNYYYLQQADNSSMIVADDKIDYLSQVYLNLKYRNFLQKMNVYTEKNKKIVDQLLSNYVFFTVFHSDRATVKDNVNKAYHVIVKEQIALNGTNLMQKVILYFVKRDNGKIIKIILYMYDLLRKKLK